MRIKWLGTASLLIEGGGSRVLIDPYLRCLNKKLPPLSLNEAATADAIFITHPHFDHFSDIKTFIRGNVKKVYVSANGIDIAKRMDIYHEAMTALRAGDEIAIGDITVRAYQSRHCKFDAATVLGIVCNPLTYFRARRAATILKGMKNYKITDDVYALEILCEGKRIVALGSAGLDAATTYPEGADLLALPYQGRARMHKYVMPLLHTFKPKAVMLDHFDNAFPPFTHTVGTKKFFAVAHKRFPTIEAFAPAENQWYEI